jgi:hypothetical protein
MVVSTSPAHDDPADSILKELRHQPDIKYVRVRRSTGNTTEQGKGKVWVYTGVRLKAAQ